MTLGKDLIGKMLISTAEGKLLGKVKDIYFDKDLTQITGIYLGAEGFLNRRPLLITRTHISLLGEDALLVSSASSVVSAEQQSEASNWVRLSELEGRSVDTAGGTKVGVVGDVLLTPSGDISGFTLARVFLEGPIAQSRTVMRTAMLDTGASDGTMTIDLAKTEKVALEMTQAAELLSGSDHDAPDALLSMDISDSSPM